MSAPRLYCEQLAVGTCELSDAESRHAFQSLRLHAGDEIIVFDGCGHIGSATLHDAPRKRGARAAISVQSIESVPAPRHTLTIITAGGKGPRLTWMVEKLTELNVTHILLTNCAHSVVRIADAHATRLRRTALEACKQSRRAWLPQVDLAPSLATALAAETPQTLLVAHPEPAAPLLGTTLAQLSSDTRAIHAVVGPEAGLEDSEVALLVDHGGTVVRLGSTILRVETAAIAIAASWAAIIDPEP